MANEASGGHRTGQRQAQRFTRYQRGCCIVADSVRRRSSLGSTLSASTERSPVNVVPTSPGPVRCPP